LQAPWRLGAGARAEAAPDPRFHLTAAIERQVLHRTAPLRVPINVTPVGRVSIPVASRLTRYLKVRGENVAMTPITDMVALPGHDHPINFTPAEPGGADATIWVDVTRVGGPHLR
jgi:hypothetical protein